MSPEFGWKCRTDCFFPAPPQTATSRRPSTERCLWLNHNFIQPASTFSSLSFPPPPPALRRRRARWYRTFSRALARPTAGGGGSWGDEASAPEPTFDISDISCALMINFFVCRVDRLGLAVPSLPTPTHSSRLGLELLKRKWQYPPDI